MTITDERTARAAVRSLQPEAMGRWTLDDMRAGGLPDPDDDD